MYIDWNENIKIPNPNPKYQVSKKVYPYEKYSYNTCEYHLEHEKYHSSKNQNKSEKYIFDKANSKIGLLHIEADSHNTLGSISAYNNKGKTGLLQYVTYYKYDKSSNHPLLIPDYIHINDNVFGELLNNKGEYGNPNNSTRRLGHGSAAIDMLIEYAIKNHFNYIDGSLSSVDEEDIFEKEWRDAFYKHKGFIITDSKILRKIS